MPLIMTNPNDRAEVDMGGFSITVKPIPHDIGQKIEEFVLNGLKFIQANALGKDSFESLGEAKRNEFEAYKLCCQYGLAGHKGLKYSDSSEVPFNTCNDSQGREIVSDETLEVYLNNQIMISATAQKIIEIRRVGVGRYKLEGEKCLEQKEGGENLNIPLSELLGKQLDSSTKSQKTSEQA